MFSWFYSNENKDLDFVKDMVHFYNEKIDNINKQNITEEEKDNKKKRINIILTCLKYYYNI
jgi:uncharacterized protein (DUF427 family)